MIEITSAKFNLNEAKKVTNGNNPYYVFADDNGQKYIVMHGNLNGQYDARCNSVLGTFKSAIVICCYPETMRNVGLNTLGDWNTETTFCYFDNTVMVMGK